MPDPVISGIDRLAAIPAFQSDLKRLLELEPADLTRVFEITRDAENLSEAIAGTAEALGEEKSSARSLVMTAVAVIASATSAGPEDTVLILSQAADDDELIELLASRRTELVSALTESPEELHEAAIDRAKSEFLPNLVDFSATWDIRPVTNDDYEVIDYVPILVLKVTSESQYKYAEVVVQLDADEFRQLREDINRLDGSMESVLHCCDGLRGALGGSQ